MAGGKVDVFMPLFVGDYLRDTGDLTAEEHGAYMLILMAMWTARGPLPRDRLQLIARVPAERWPAAWATLERFFVDAGGGRVAQTRLLREVSDATARRERAAVNGAKGGRPRTKTQTQIETQPEPKPEARPNPQKSSSPSPSPSPSDPPSPAPSLVPRRSEPAGVFAMARDEFVRLWEKRHGGEKYPFVPKDGVQLAALFKANPQIAGKWATVVTRYLDDAWPDEHGRHGLAQLCTGIVRYAAPRANGTRASGGKVRTADDVDGMLDRVTTWMPPEMRRPS